jgi:hypothetical protein
MQDAGRTVIQLVAKRSEQPDGVTDYACALARSLLSCCELNTVFVSATQSPAAIVHDEWRTVSLSDRRARTLQEAIATISSQTETKAVILHFSGYGYQKRGVPIWLIRSLKQWKEIARIPLITIFHELYASGRPWQTAFWLSPVQQWIARNILNLSSTAVTTVTVCKHELDLWNKTNGTEINLMPVFSSIGEPRVCKQPDERENTAVIFGLAGVEDRLFGSYRNQLERIIAMMRIQRIFDVGPRRGKVPLTLAEVPLTSRGILSRSDLSDLLRETKFGFIAYPLHCIGKSSVFAAYAAHGVVPIVLSDLPQCSEGLEADRHFIDGLRLKNCHQPHAITEIQARLRTWYAGHSLAAQARFLGERVVRTKTVPDMG